MPREFGRGRRSAQRTVSQEAVPAALIAPTRSELRKEQVPASRLHAERYGVAVRTPIALRKEVKEKNRREYGAQDEEAANDDDAQDRVPHRSLPAAVLEALLHVSPRFHVRDVGLDALDHDIGIRGDRSAGRATGAQ